MRNIKLVIEYDGAGYHGWQSQANAVSIQDVLEDAIGKLTGEKCRLIGSGRTDAGAHAIGQVANFHTASNIPGDRFSSALNSLLPGDIVIRESMETTQDFHARYSAKGKKYAYLFYNSAKPSALLRNRAFHVPQRLDFDAMQKAASYFLGCHDFSAFRASGSSVKNSIRTITEVRFDRLETPELYRLLIAGDGFLYNMVRIIAGTLVDVGTGKLDPSAIPALIESRDRRKAGKTAPAHGLYLIEVFY